VTSSQIGAGPQRQDHCPFRKEPVRVKELRHPRHDDGERAALRVLAAARDHVTAERTATLNALIALVCVVDLGIDARRALTSKQIAEGSRWRTRDEQIGLAIARTEAVRLAKRVAEPDGDIATITCMTLDPATRAYVEQRTTEGRTAKEIRRCLKRYLARQIYRALNVTDATASPA
jgi:hypothetical protein